MKKLTFEELEMVTGGDEAAADVSKKKIIIPEKNYREGSPLERRTAAGRFCSCAGETFSVFPLLRL